MLIYQHCCSVHLLCSDDLQREVVAGLTLLIPLLLQVAIALSLLVAEVTAPPFNETVCTFSAQPQLHAIKEGSLVSKVTSHLLMH